MFDLTRWTVPIEWSKHAKSRCEERFCTTYKIMEKDLRKYLRSMKKCTHCGSYMVKEGYVVYVFSDELVVITVYQKKDEKKYGKLYPLHTWVDISKQETKNVWNQMYIRRYG